MMRETGLMGKILLFLHLNTYCNSCSACQNTHRPGADVLVKSHHMQYLREVEKADQTREDLDWRMQNVAYFHGGGVLLIRNPFDAIRYVHLIVS